MNATRIGVEQSGGIDSDLFGRRERVLAALLDQRPQVRQDALWEVRARHWVTGVAADIEVWAVLVDDLSDVPTALSFGARVTSATHGRVRFIGLKDGAAMFVAPLLPHAEQLADVLDHEADESGTVVRAFAVALCRPDALDIGDAITSAVSAVAVRALLPNDVASVRAEELGGWLLLRALPRSPALISSTCPAAADLFDGDRVQLETVEAYLDAAGRAPAACERLHVHRTTLYYRLDHLPASVRDALSDGLQRSTLHLAIKLSRLWERDAVVEREGLASA